MEWDGKIKRNNILVPKERKQKCLCFPQEIVKNITSWPKPLPSHEINDIRLALFTERNTDGTLFLVLRGNDLIDRFQQRIEDKDMHAICRYIRGEPKRITKLDLAYNHITDAGFFILLKKCLVKGRSSITNLNIMNNQLTEESVNNLAKYAKMIRLKYLRINGNKIGTEGGILLARFLTDNQYLQFLDLGDSDQTLKSITFIVEALRNDRGQINKSLKVLDLSRLVPRFNRYPIESKYLVYHIELLLMYTEVLIELHLQKNQLMPHDMEYLVRGLGRNKSLKYLDLGYNKISDYGMEIIAAFFKTKPNILYLNVAGNAIGNTGARSLSFCLPFSKIRALDLGDNQMTDRGLTDILHSLRKPVFMRFLNIWGNNITDKTCKVLKLMLQTGVIFQHTTDVWVYEIDGILHAAYYCNPAHRNKHLYYCEIEYAFAQDILNITKNVKEPQPYKMGCKQRRRLNKTDKNHF